MKISKIALAVCATLALATSASAGVKRDCTIGWYKNNGFDDWYNRCVEIEGDSAPCDALNAQLYTTGAHAGDAKNAAADIIVANYLGKDGELCEEAQD
jgi:hypothetical protein